MAHTLGLEHLYGVLVKNVYPGGPADKAGITKGDFIASLDGHEIEDGVSLHYQVAITPTGENGKIKIIRHGEVKELSITLTEPMNAKDPTPLTIEGRNPLRGAQIRTLSPALAFEMGISPMKQGVVISGVLKATPAARLGIRPGDIILSINNKQVVTKEDAVRLLQSEEKSWVIVLGRGTRVLTFNVSAG
jgi:serine protease Do